MIVATPRGQPAWTVPEEEPGTEPPLGPRGPEPRLLTPERAVALPLAFALALTGCALVPSIRSHPHLLWSYLGGAAACATWSGILFGAARRRGRTLRLEIVLRKQHYVQACAQGTVLLCWGWYWRPAYDWAPFIAAQLLFAYSFDILLAWSRRDTYTLGFAPFPVIFSINLFLWFREDWFYLQFLMVALGFAAKELLRWDIAGRRAHIFNPSAFPLAVFSLALILTGTSGITRGQEIAITQFFPPHMYAVLFLVGLPGQFFFGVTMMTMSAVVTTYLFGVAYFAITGTYFFYDSYIPIAVFLGMHLLFTDPSTSPRTELGRLIFGMLYGLSTVALYAALGAAGVPPFYDKLLQVPILNLAAPAIDRAARSRSLRVLDPGRLGQSLAPRQRHLAHMSIWTIVFLAMSAAGAVGDRHPGQWMPFWQRTCAEGRPRACAYLETVASRLCRQGSGWACNELGIVQASRNQTRAADSLGRGCERGFPAACANVRRLTRADSLESAPPPVDDYPILLRGSKAAITDRTPAALYARACARGWPEACGKR